MLTDSTNFTTALRYQTSQSVGKRNEITLSSLVLVIPLACSFILTVVGIVAVIFVNRHYSEEAASTFPITIATSVSLYIRREVEAEMSVPLLAVHKPLAAMYATGLMPIPIYNATSPTTRIVPVGSSDTSLLQVRDEENARRAKWHQLMTTESVRVIKSTRNMVVLSSIFASDAQSRWEVTSPSSFLRVGVSSQLRGSTFYGSDVQLVSGTPRIAEVYQSSIGPLRSVNSTWPTTFALLEQNSGYKYFVRWISYWQKEHTLANSSSVTHRQQMLASMRKAMKPYLGITLSSADWSRGPTFNRVISSPILNTSGSVIGIVDTQFDFESVGKSIELISERMPESAPNAGMKITAFILSESGSVLAAAGASVNDLLMNTRSSSSGFIKPPHKRCVLQVLLGSVEGQYDVDSTCERFPSEFTSNPVIQASAPHLASVCGDDSPLLGTATSVTLPVDGSERPFAIICEKLSSPGDSYFYESYGSNFSSWRIVTLVSERELVDPLVRVMPGTLLAAGLGIGICALACIVAGVVAYVLNKKGVFKVDDGVAEHIENI